MKFKLPQHFLTKRNAIRAAAATGIVAVAIAGTVALKGTFTATAGLSPMGKINIEVYDGNSNQPLEGASVVVVETKDSFPTLPDGSTGSISLPILADKRYESSISKPWGEVTLLCYKEGYVPYALFGTQIWENQERKGPKIYMFPNSEAGESPFSIVEGPQRLWVNELTQKFQPSK